MAPPEGAKEEETSQTYYVIKVIKITKKKVADNQICLFLLGCSRKRRITT